MYGRQSDEQAVKWAKQIKERDNYVCQLCFAYGVSLHSHHLNSWDLFVEQRYVLANGITLCSDCHERFHSIYGNGKNTAYQFQQYKKSYDLMKQAFKLSLK